MNHGKYEYYRDHNKNPKDLIQDAIDRNNELYFNTLTKEVQYIKEAVGIRAEYLKGVGFNYEG